MVRWKTYERYRIYLYFSVNVLVTKAVDRVQHTPMMAEASTETPTPFNG